MLDLGNTLLRSHPLELCRAYEIVTRKFRTALELETVNDNPELSKVANGKRSNDPISLIHFYKR